MIERIITKIKNTINFKSGNYWERRYATGGTSGAGSYGLHAQAKATIFNMIIKDYSLNEIVEFGCGDGNQLGMYNIQNYLGLDVSKTAIQNTAAKYESHPNKSFMVYDPKAFFLKKGPFKFQTAISIDVLFHLPEEVVFNQYMSDLFSAATKYVVICSSNHINNEGATCHVRHRKFTDYIDTHLPNWKLKETRECSQSDGKVLDPFYIFIKN